MIVEFRKALSSAEKWADNNNRTQYFYRCIICHKPVEGEQPAEIVYTKRKEWLMFHRSCYEKELIDLWKNH